MARTIAQIKQQLLDAKNAESKLSSLNSPSQVSYWNLWLFIQAVAINFFEQILDVYTLALELLVTENVPGTPLWLQGQVFKFQYDATTPQITNINTTTFKIEYPTEDTTLRIITRCSVKTDDNRIANVKVAKSEPPEKLSALELSALQSYVNTIGFSGVQANVISLDPDRVYVEADVYYNGQYSAVIEANVIAALDSYLSQIPFDGYIKVSELEDAIQSVTGVTDVVLKNVFTRDAVTPFGTGTSLVSDYKVLIRNYQTIAGYIIGEDTAGETFADSLNFVVG